MVFSVCIVFWALMVFFVVLFGQDIMSSQHRLHPHVVPSYCKFHDSHAESLYKNNFKKTLCSCKTWGNSF